MIRIGRRSKVSHNRKPKEREGAMPVISGVKKDILTTIERSGRSDEELQKIMESGMFHDFLRMDPHKVNRSAFRRMVNIEDNYQYEVDHSLSVANLMEMMQIENCTEMEMTPQTFPVIKEEKVSRIAERICPDVKGNVGHEEDLFALYRLRHLKPASLFEVLSFILHNNHFIRRGERIGAFDETMHEGQGEHKLWYMLLVTKLRSGGYVLHKQYVGCFDDSSVSLLGITRI